MHESWEAGPVAESEKTRIPIRLPSGEHCTACTISLESGVDSIPGVGSVEIDPGASELLVTFDPSTMTRERLIGEVERLGHEVGAAISHASWRISGLDCPDCARTVDVSVAHLDGVLSANLNFASGVLFAEYDSASDPRPAIEDLIGRMGYGYERIGDAAGLPIAEFRLSGLDCPDCARSVAERIRSLDGVGSAEIDFASARLRVGFDTRVASAEEIIESITAAGYGVVEGGMPGAVPVAAPGMTPQSRAERATIVSGVLIALGWVATWLAGENPTGVRELLVTLPFALSIVVGGGLIARRALSSVRARVLDMNVLMTIAVIGAALIGEWTEAAAVVFLFSIGGMLEVRSLDRTRSSIRDLMDLAPPTAHLLRGSTESEVSPAEVNVGDHVIVRPGERVPLDGAIVTGFSAMDEAAITGESVPADKGPGDRVFAGTLNTHGLLEIEVTSPAEDTTLARVIYLVEEAQAQRAPFQRLVDRFTRWYTPAVTGLAFAIAVVPPLIGAVFGPDLPFDASFSVWFYRALVLLVVSCPCALVISTPVAIVSAITRASRDGVLVKGGAFLELAPRIRALAFDKTGTLTIGRPELVEVAPVDGQGREDLLAVAAALESASTHPVARAVVRAAEGSDAVATDVRETPGRGVRGTVDGLEALVGSALFAQEEGFELGQAAQVVDRLETEGRTCLVVAAGGRVIGVLGVADTLRENAPAAVNALRAGGIEWFTMVTGDNERVAEPISRAVGLDGFDARTLPHEKVEVVRALKERWGAVAMVGDGVNDAPALALADLGIAMGAAGSDTALETADIALMADDLSALPRFFALGRSTVSIIRQNVWFSVAIKLAVLVAAVIGYAPLWLAVLADTGVALLVILNSLRLLRPKPVRAMSVPGV